MRLFFIGWSGKDWGLSEVVSKLRVVHDIVYWSGDGQEFASYREKFLDTIFHDHFDALRGIPAPGIDVSTFPPPGEALLAKLLGVESIVLTMMNKRFESMLTSERKHVYYTYVQYWHGVLTSLRPDAIIFPCVPHTVYDFVIYSLAKLLSIKTIFFELTVIGARSLVMRDFMSGSAALSKAVADNKSGNFELGELSLDIRHHFEWQLNAKETHTPVYMVKQFRAYSGLNKFFMKCKSFWFSLKVHRDVTVFMKLLTYVPRHFGQNMRKEYASVEIVPDFSKKFIYVPLNYQPERTSSPQGGVFVDQLLMLKTLSMSVPQDWLIYVKEHPAQWLYRGPDFFSYRYRGYYKEIAKLKNVRVVPVGTDTYTLMNRSVAVATLTGTAGWEAILRSKPIIVFGYPWYQHAPGLLRANDVSTCREAVAQIASGFVPTKQEIIRYLVSLDKASFLGYCDPQVNGVQFAMEADTNAENISQAIETELRTP